MRFGEKLIVFLFRPIYRTFFERLTWWFLTRIKVFFLAEVIASLTDLTARMERIENRPIPDQSGVTGALDEKFRSLEAANLAQWRAMETLLLAMFRQSESRIVDERFAGRAAEHEAVNGIRPERANVATNIR